MNNSITIEYVQLIDKNGKLVKRVSVATIFPPLDLVYMDNKNVKAYALSQSAAVKEKNGVHYREPMYLEIPFEVGQTIEGRLNAK